MGTMDDLCEACPSKLAAGTPLARHTAPLAPELARTMQAGRALFQGFDPTGRALVSVHAGSPAPVIAARTTVALGHDAIGAEVLMVWEPDPAAPPIIVGIIQPLCAGAAPAPERLSIRADAREYLISAEREIVLQCGDASITLTRAGKVIIKGNYVVSRSAGCNKIKGAAVEIN